MKWFSKVYYFQKRAFLRSMKLTQISASTAHRARETVEILSRETSDFTSLLQWLQNKPDLNPVVRAIRGNLQEHVYYKRIRDFVQAR